MIIRESVRNDKKVQFQCNAMQPTSRERGSAGGMSCDRSVVGAQQANDEQVVQQKQQATTEDKKQFWAEKEGPPRYM